MTRAVGETAHELERLITLLREELRNAAAPNSERGLRQAIALLHGAIDVLDPLGDVVVEQAAGDRTAG